MDEKRSMNPVDILLVEDNADHRELMRLALTGHDLTWQVEGVVSGEEALRHLAEEEREKLIRELQEALAKVKTLTGLLPICASCKKIRDDKGYWNQIEAYIRDHSEAEFSHGICPECMKKLYGTV